MELDPLNLIGLFRPPEAVIEESFHRAVAALPTIDVDPAPLLNVSVDSVPDPVDEQPGQQVDAVPVHPVPGLDELSHHALTHHLPGRVVIEQLALHALGLEHADLAPEDLAREQALVWTLQVAITNATARQQARTAESTNPPDHMPPASINQPPVLGDPAIDASDVPPEVINNQPPPAARLVTLSGHNGAFGRSEEVSTSYELPDHHSDPPQITLPPNSTGSGGMSYIHLPAGFADGLTARGIHRLVSIGAI